MEHGITFSGAPAPGDVQTNGVHAPPTQDTIWVCPMRRDHSMSWALIGDVVERIMTFCVEYDSDFEPEAMRDIFLQGMTMERPSWLFLAIMQGHDVIGHFLANAAMLGANPVCTIVQYKCDQRVPRNIADQGLSEIEEWARGWGCKQIQCLVKVPRLAQHFKQWGFQTTHALMRRPVSEV